MKQYHGEGGGGGRNETKQLGGRVSVKQYHGEGGGACFKPWFPASERGNMPDFKALRGGGGGGVPISRRLKKGRQRRRWYACISSLCRGCGLN